MLPKCSDLEASEEAALSSGSEEEPPDSSGEAINGELDASCYHVSMKMSIDAATPRLCGELFVPLKCDALAAALPVALGPAAADTAEDDADDDDLPSPPPNQAMPARSGTPPCQLLERLNFPEGNIINTLHTILALPPFDPYAPPPRSEVVYKDVVSLMQWSLRDDNAIELELSDKLLHECEHKSNDPNEEARSYLMAIENMRLFSEDPKNPLRDADGQLRAITNLAFIFVKHRKDEFFTFCSCKECLEYRETIMAIMMDQFKAAHMVVMLLDVLIKAYSPMLKNDAAYNKFEKLLECNKEIYWITSGYLYDKNAEYLDFIDDTAISDNMILVLFSAILMANNPMLLLQILAYNVECIVKAFSEGMIEIAQNVQENEKISAERMLTYILDGYSDLNCISQKISLSLFAFENDFLRKFKLSWVLLCQRLFQQHVFSPLGDTMLACILSLKEAAPSVQTTALIKRYMLFDEHMHSIERRWTDIWIELNKFNLSDTEHDRRMGLLDVYNIFDKVVLDATSFSLPDISDDEFIDFQRIVDRQLAWKNIMAFTKLKWPDGFYDPPNKLVHEDLCKKCNALLEHHHENRKCITCSIAGTPLRPRQAGHCAKCTTLGIVEKDPKLMKSKILSTCTSDEAKHNAATAASTSSAAQQQQRRCSELADAAVDEQPSGSGSGAVFRRQSETDVLRTTYHIAWAVFQHLTTRKRYRHEAIESQYFCGENCRVSACQLARKILANQLSPPLTKYLLRCFQPLSFTREELRSTLPSLMFFNRKLAPSPAELQELKNQHYVYKTYWTFVLSIYANFFVKFNSSSTDFRHLELLKGDLRLRLNSVVGDKDDGRFEQFLAQVIGYSPFKITDDFTLGDANIEKMQFGVDQLMMLHDSQIIKRTKPDSTTGLAASKSKASDITMTQPGGRAHDGGGSKKSKEKMRKCCADYADIGEPCKENHSKKRVKKECSHARYNETRDRLRKKLSQIVNDRKSKNGQEAGTPPIAAAAPGAGAAAAAAPPPKAKPKTEPEAAATGAAANPPKRPPKAESVPANASCNPNPKQNQPASLKVCATAQLQSSLSPPAAAPAPAALNEMGDEVKRNNDSLLCLHSLCKSIPVQPDAATSAEAYAEGYADGYAATVEADDDGADDEEGAAIEGESNSNSYPSDYTKEEMMNDFAEFLGSYTREQDQQRWINETLNFIEGKSQQPQTMNPKKAAKKAKQKQRKEEEKRIRELEDLRSQFLGIYFKEFVDKYEMKALTAAGGRKREKKRISELEANIKNLQRAKGKVETAILELIATVKQANSEFKFSYLPTKEQQLAKLDEIIKGRCSGAAGQTTQPAPTTLQYPDFSGGCPTTTTFFPGQQNAPPACYAPSQQQHQQPPHNHQQQQQQQQHQQQQLFHSITADPSKRIVTIRRVQLPHPGAEQQVTVVAKGSSPHEDKLLYTFVNGHMVASAHPDTVALAPSHPQQQQQPPPGPSVPEKSAKAKKKEAKRAAAAAAAATAAANAAAAAIAAAAAATAAAAAAEQEAKSQNAAKSKKQQKKKGVAAVVGASSSASNSSSKSHTPQSSAVNTRENSVCSVQPKSATSKKSAKSAPEVKPTKPKTEAKPAPLPEPPKRQKRVKPRLDQGQLDNNPFKSLHMQDSSEGDCSTDSETEEGPALPPPPPPPKPVPKAHAVSAPKQAPVSAVPPMASKPKAAATPAPVKRVKSEAVPQKSQLSQAPKKPPQTSVNPRKGTASSIKTGQSHHQPQQQQQQPGKSQSQRTAESSRKQKVQGHADRQQQQQPQQPQQQQQSSRGGRGSGRSKLQQQSQQHSDSTSNVGDPSAAPASKRSQRGKRGHRQKQEDLSGIPHNMGYFNPNEVAIPPAIGSYASTLAQQMQHLRIGSTSSKQQQQQSPNCSIMDQLNRGVQVEHLSLPPGITLTKVDPAKSEQLRQKSESIRLLSKPMVDQPQQQQHQHQQHLQHHTFQQSHLMAGYYGAAGGSGGMDNNAVIMVEANPRPNRNSQSFAASNVAVAASAASASGSGKSSRRRRRNRGKSGSGSAGGGHSGGANKQRTGAGDQQKATSATIESSAGNIITLRNPMFHQGNGPAAVAGSMMPPNPNPMPAPARNFGGGLPAAPPPMGGMDPPAAIIKNENGMFTIRNPALHQAVTNGLAMGGFRQFGSNVSYYTPQEAAAEAARATQQQQQQQQQQQAPASSHSSSSSSSVAAASSDFSYFSSGSVSIHNISESNFTRNNTSPTPHRVEITSVFGNRGHSSNANPYEQQASQAGISSSVNYCDSVGADYGSDSHMFVQSGMMPRLSQAGPGPAPGPDFVYDFETGSQQSKPASVASDLNEFLRRSPLSQRTSPYSPDENAAALETFVQNMNALQIASDAEQCSRLNGTGGGPNDALVADATAGGVAAAAAASWW
ncbi:GL24379 [Drosophila persimilis]|uniref:GL24379 n=1 Tax=Drosophila persimilis TaxID=7234 RepID=B4G5K2_DROPE|nr:GL24379 [Drosophila persimilis]